MQVEIIFAEQFEKIIYERVVIFSEMQELLIYKVIIAIIISAMELQISL